MTSRTILAIVCLAALAGCGGGGSTPAPSAPPEPMQPAPGGPPFIEGSFTASDAATSACENALAAQTTGGVRVVGSEASEAAHAVYMRVGDNGAPWRCLVAEDGSDPSTMFMGSDGGA